MKGKKLVSLVLIAILVTNCYSQNGKKDTIRKVSWAVRIAGGVNILRHDISNYDSQSYSVNTGSTNGSTAQIGIKLTTMPRKVFSITSELNYVILQNKLKYNGGDRGLGGSTIDNADYILTSHNIQFAILPKITIGSKKIIFISFGLYGQEPFYYSNKGIMTTTQTSWATSVSIAKKDNEIRTGLGLNWGAIANFGVDIPLKKQKLSIEMRLQPGLTHFMHSPDLLNYSVLLSAAYTFGKTNAIIQFHTD